MEAGGGSCVIVDAQLIDAEQPEPRLATVVVVEGHVVDVMEGGGRPSGDRRAIDLRGSYLLPGLWDAHTHLEWRPRTPDATVADLTLRYAQQVTRALTRSGVVGVRTGGVPHFIDVVLREAVRDGRLLGPRVFAGGYFLTTTAGHLAWSSWSRECDGSVEFVRAIRDQVKNGVDHVKLNLSGGIMGPIWDQHSDSYWLDGELDPAFEIAHLRGYPVMAHATNPRAVKAALSRGAHSIEHGYEMDEECISLFLDTGAWYVPTLCISHLTPSQASSHWERKWVAEHDLRPDLVERADAAVGEHRRAFQAALAADVNMALGSDAGPLEQAVFQEMELWVKDGATPLQTIAAATKGAADMCGVGNETGTISPSKAADLLVVSANPLEDINNLRDVEIVIQAGEVVSDHRN